MAGKQAVQSIEDMYIIHVSAVGQRPVETKMKFHRLGGNYVLLSCWAWQYGMIIKGITQPIIMLFALLLRTFIRRMVWPLSKRLLHFSDKHCCVERLYIFVCLLCLSVLSLNTTLIATNIYYFSIDGFIFTKRF